MFVVLLAFRSLVLGLLHWCTAQRLVSFLFRPVCVCPCLVCKFLFWFWEGLIFFGAYVFVWGFFVLGLGGFNIFCLWGFFVLGLGGLMFFRWRRGSIPRRSWRSGEPSV